MGLYTELTCTLIRDNWDYLKDAGHSISLNLITSGHTEAKKKILF